MSILTSFTPSKLSITAVESAEVSVMAPWAARRVRAPKRRITPDSKGAAQSTIRVRTQSWVTMTTRLAITVTVAWV